MRLSRFIFGLGFLSAAATAAFAASNSADALHLHVQIIVPAAQLSPGASSEAGLYFKLDPGWHVYWQNAGDSGEPPHIQWTLPDGITAGPLQFPAPQRLPLGPLMDFGYENEVLFPFNLDVASSAKPGPVALHAKVAWLVCREVCIPGKAELEVDRVIAAAGAQVAEVSPDKDIYDRLVGRLPQPLPANDRAVFQPTATGFRLAVSTGQRETQAVFFPEDQNIVDNPAPQQLTPTPKGFFLDLKKDANLTASPAKLNGVVELSGGRNYEIAAMPGAVAVAPAFSFAALARIVGLAFHRRPDPQPDAVRLSRAVLERPRAGQFRQRGKAQAARSRFCLHRWNSRFILGARRIAARFASGRRYSRVGIPVPITGFSFADGRTALLSWPLACRPVRNRPHAHQRRRLARSETRLCGQLLHGSSRRRCRYAVHGAVHGSGHRLCARATCRRHLRCLYGARSRPRRALRRAHTSTCMDATAAEAGRVDGYSQASYFGSHLWYRHLAGVGGRSSLRSQLAACAAVSFPVARDRRMVSWPLAGEAGSDCSCRGHSARCGGGLRCCAERVCRSAIFRVASAIIRGRCPQPTPGSHGLPTPFSTLSPRASQCLSTSLRAGA